MTTRSRDCLELNNTILLRRLAIAFAAGLMIGFERGWVAVRTAGGTAEERDATCRRPTRPLPRQPGTMAHPGQFSGMFRRIHPALASDKPGEAARSRALQTRLRRREADDLVNADGLVKAFMRVAPRSFSWE